MGLLTVLYMVVITISGLVGVYSSDEKGCPPNFEFFNYGCYFIGQFSVTTYNQARNNCHRLGGYLLNIDGKPENDYVVGELQNQHKEFDGYWTGGIFDGQQWVWQKTKNGVVVKKIMDPDGYSSWGPGQLGDWSDQYNKMAIMRNFVLEPYKWYSLKPWSAAVTMGYICEAEYKLR